MASLILERSLANLKLNNGLIRGAYGLIAPTDLVYQQYRFKKHWNPKFKKERAAKFLKIKLPDYDEERKTKNLSVAELKERMKEKGIAPHRPWNEKPLHIGCLSQIVDAYIPPEGDGKASFISKEGVKQTYDGIGKKGKSYLALRKIRNLDYEFDIPTVAELAKNTYIEAQAALARHDEDKLHELVTEKAFPEMIENTENKQIKWKFIQTLDHPRVVHIRVQELISKENQFAQLTLRLHSQQMLTIYDRFGRLIYGSEDQVRDTLEYIVFEKHLSALNGTWRIHGKIIPDWMPPKEPIRRTYFLPFLEKPSESDVETGTPAAISESNSTSQVESVKQQ